MKKYKELRDLFEKTIDQAIKLKLGLDIFRYQENKHIVNSREFTAELAVNCPIRGTGVAFGSEIFSNWGILYDSNSIINSEKLIESGEITEELKWQRLPQDEMVIVYLFTMLEDFGNSIMKIVNPNLYGEYQSKDRSWHSGVNKYKKEKGKDLLVEFAEPFGLNTSDVDGKLVDLFYDLKQKRNKIAHELSYCNRQLRIHNFWQLCVQQKWQ